MDTNQGLPSNLFQQIREILLTFDVFDDERPLRHRFIDERLAPWRHQLPQADNRQQRVTAVIITSGPFAAYESVFERYQLGQKRVQMLIEPLGRWVTVGRGAVL